LAVDAFSGAVSVLPGCFTVGVSGSGLAFDPPEEELRDGRVAAVEQTATWQRWEAAVGPYVNPTMLATTLAIVVIFGIWIAATFKWGVVFGMGVGVVAGVGGALAVPHTLMKVVFVIIILLVLVGGAYW